MDIVSGDNIILEFSTFEDRFVGEVVEVTGDGRLMVCVSMPEAVVERMKVHASALIRYAFDGHLLGYSTQVLGLDVGTASIVELACPKDVFDAEDRCEPRCSCLFPAIIGEGERTVQAVIEDMSDSCSRIRYLHGGLAEFPENLDRRVRLTFFPYEDKEESHSVGCSVVKAFIKNGDRYAVLRYTDDEPDSRQRLSDFMSRQVCCVISPRRN